MPAELYLARVSVNCHGPWLALELGGVEHEVKDVDLMKGETRTPEFLAMNPAHCVPTLKDGETSLWESNAIMRYICTKYDGAKKFYPSDPKARGICDLVLDWRQTTLYKTIGEATYGTLGFAEISEEKAAAAVAALKRENDGGFAMLEYFLGSKPFVCGDDVTIADFAVVTGLKFLEVIPDKVTLPPKIAEYVARFNEKTKYEEIADGKGSFGINAYIKMKLGQ
ncbi:Glutathione S-transferase 1 [Diplonema papillatum]|nr:Glutathione S-transferase 1 [Diplonema papillatum]|eukprot:gene19699-30360_t